MNAKIDLVLMALAALLAGIILKVGFGGERNFDEAALGTLTVGYEAKNAAGQCIHTVKQLEADMEDMLASIHPERETILFLGNSQTHSINQWEDGQVNYIERLDRQATKHNILCNSLPNANLQEMHLIASWWMSQIDIQQLVVPVFMDDLREDGLRKEFISAILASDFQLEAGVPLNEEINRELEALRNPTEQAAETGRQTPQDVVEKRLNEALSARSEIWRNRPNARGDFFLKLYQWRNTLFGINASTKRKMIPTRYAANMTALDLLLTACNQRGIQALVYIPPIRTDVEVPYDVKEYESFVAQVEQLAHSRSAQFANLERLVPGPLWGLKGSTTAGGEPELDFMHFQAEGHRLLAEALAPLTLEAP